MIKQILINLGLVTAIGGLFGIIGEVLFESDFLRWFSVSILLQFIFFFIFNSIVYIITNYKLMKLNVERQNILDQNSITLPCANCSHPNTTLVNVNSSENSFTCSECGVKNSISVMITNAQKTDIIYKKDVLTQDDIKELV